MISVHLTCKPDHRLACPQLAMGGAAELGAKLAPGTVERLCAYSQSVAHFPTAVKEFPWRNGWFWQISQREMAAGRPDPFPTHTRMLKAQGVVQA